VFLLPISQCFSLSPVVIEALLYICGSVCVHVSAVCVCVFELSVNKDCYYPINLRSFTLP